MNMALAQTPSIDRRRATRDQRSLEALYQAGKVLAGPTESARMLVMVLNVLDACMGLRRGAIALAVAAEDRLDDSVVNPYVIAATTDSDDTRPPGCGAVPERVARTLFRTGVAAVTDDVERELGADALPAELAGLGPVALFAAPITDGDRSPLTLGVICCYRVLGESDGPCDLDQDLRLLRMIANLVSHALRFRRIVARDRARLTAATRIEGEDCAGPALPSIIGDSPVMRSVAARIRKVAPTRATVLLRGESGTGKELFARAIHENSPRKSKPFVKVNCAALSETLLESELFGHEKGSFTGAVAQKKGRFEMADGGTLFLDEIGEISPAFQAKLLRVLQEGEFERVGGSRSVSVDVRLVTATNRDLEAAVAKGDFRADLYFRICVVPILLPPLRERQGDIPRLAEAFLDSFNRENGARLRFTRDAIEVLRGCYFPGNVRELENCVHRVAALSSGQVISAEELACQNDACLSSQLWKRQGSGAPVGGLAPARVVLPVLNPALPAPCAAKPAPCASAPPAPCASGPRPSAPQSAADAERDERAALVEAMERAGWVQAKAARLMGLTPRQIGYALKKHGVDVQRF